MNVRIHHSLRVPRRPPGGTTPHSAGPGGRPPQTPPGPRLSARWRKPPSYRALGAALGLCGLALAAGCGVAPVGATANSSAIGPVRTGNDAKNFPVFPVPAVWNARNDMPYEMVAKSKAGTAPRKFEFTVRQSMVFWLNCIGTGTARLASPALGLAWSIPCGNGADPVGITFNPPHAAQGKPAKVLVTASAGSRWEFRVDEPAPAGAAG